MQSVTQPQDFYPAQADYYYGAETAYGYEQYQNQPYYVDEYGLEYSYGDEQHYQQQYPVQSQEP